MSNSLDPDKAQHRTLDLIWVKTINKSEQEMTKVITRLAGKELMLIL